MELRAEVLTGLLLLTCPVVAERANPCAPPKEHTSPNRNAVAIPLTQDNDPNSGSQAQGAKAGDKSTEGAKTEAAKEGAAAVPPLETQALRKETDLSDKLTAAQREKVTALGKALATQSAQTPADKMPKPFDEMAREAVLGAGFDKRDLEPLAFLVLMQAAKSTQEDVKAIMAQVKAINHAKLQCKTVACLATLKPTPDFGKRELDAIVERVKNSLDSLSEMGEMESLRLQMAMDRMSKLMSTLSNMLKKLSDTGQSITQNIK